MLSIILFVSLAVTRTASAAERPLAEAVSDPAWDAVFDRTDGWIGGDAIYSTPLPGATCCGYLPTPSWGKCAMAAGKPV